MTALNFQPQFEADIKAGLKPHTLRADRKHPIKPGDILQLYTGMRQKGCRRLGEAVCLAVAAVRLNVAAQTVEFGHWDQMPGVTVPNYGNPGQFARADGFQRVEDLFAFFAPRADEAGHFTGNLYHWGNTFEADRTQAQVSAEALDTLRHMLGMDPRKRANWGYRNYFCGEADNPPPEMAELQTAGYIHPGHTINDGRDRYWKATLRGMRYAGLKNEGIARAVAP